jgi:putative alpha-1,2-mannosidase
MALGLFSLQGNTSQNPIYEITSPIFDEITINLNPDYYAGKQFVIKTYNNSEKNCYIQKAQLNGKPLNNCWFTHSEFAKGGLLEIWLGPEPNKTWGISDPPTSQLIRK